MRTSRRLPIASLAVWVASVAPAWAGDAVDAAATPIDDRSSTAMASSAPRLTRSDVPNVTGRSLPGYRTDLTQLNYRWWASSGRADVGVGVASVALVGRPTGMLPGLTGDGSVMSAGSGTMTMLGLRYRATDRSTLYADATDVRGLGLESDVRVVGKVGLELKSAQSSWNIAYGGLGFRLAGDSQMTLKVRRGGLGLYMRSTF